MIDILDAIIPPIPTTDSGHLSKVKVPIEPYVDGALPHDQAAVMLSILVAENPAEILEVGTFMGHTTRLMAETLPSSIIHTVDLPDVFENDPPKSDTHLIARRDVGIDFKWRPCASRIKQYLVDTAKWDFQVDGRPTFFFIDGSHTYEYVKNDSEKCFNLCDGHGVFLWDNCDIRYPGIVQFIQEWRWMGRDIRRILGTSIAYWKSF